ncbi:PBECR2 nuclease fold domain-containing protein [uncultured Clostridium sp.]|uniref:PBECR3 domain-containing polyvalent protein n=1 Tax=uncultured Clostridium sp. TaxID=59620 RepID=UPI0028E48395|nr:PBECR2 nuclease fold domain-containing protein [uncultured Clostridium sp.]
MKKMYRIYKKVGNLNISLIEELIEYDFPSSVYISSRVINHIIKKHGKQFTKTVKNHIIKIMEEIIRCPDYIGIDPLRSNSGALELVKKIDSNILLALEYDEEGQYIYVATMYPITESRMISRLNSGRLISCNNEETQDIF